MEVLVHGGAGSAADEPAARAETADPPAADARVGERLAWVREHFGGTDTVGAVATDGDRTVAATSTAGRGPP
jgi:L-asparaginase/beta-aspartyl-peptidase (threonine type)